MRFERLAALGAIGVCFGVLALVALIAWGSTPSETGGIDRTNAILAYMGAAIPALGIIAVHLVYSRVLMREDARLRARGAAGDTA